MRQQILLRLKAIEKERGIKILYACESGSRAWGFPSADSDYDVRFIYLHPVEWYLSIRKKRDVIEYPPEDLLDVRGWDLPKALSLLRKSNASLLEWLGSPIVYQEKYSIASQMRKLASRYFSPTSSLLNYFNIAHRNYTSYLQGDMVWRKKYLYALRSVLAMQWLTQGRGLVPTEFMTLVDELVRDKELYRDIQFLLNEKRNGGELDRGPRIASISHYIATELNSFYKKKVGDNKSSFPMEQLDVLFLEALTEVWSIRIIN